MLATQRINAILKWTALVFTIGGALLTSFKVTPWNVSSFSAGAFLYLIWSYRIREWNLVIVNGVLLVIYAIGIFMNM
jgi:hypothetical protein